MAGDRIEIDFTANVAEVIKGTDDIADGLDTATDSLEDVGDAGERAGADVADGLEDAQDAAEETGDALGDVGDALGDVGDIATDALNGDLGSAAEGALDAISGLAEGIPGVGGLIGTAIGEVGKGIIGIFEQAAEESEARVGSMYDAMIQSGVNYYTEEQAHAAAADLIKTNYDRIREVAELTGLTEAQVVRAMVTAGDDRNALLDIANEKYQEQLALVSTGADYTDKSSAAASALAAQYGKVVGEFANYNTEQSTAIDKIGIFREATSTAFSEAELGVQDLQSATDAFRPIPIRADLSEAERQVDEFVGRSRRIIVRVDASSVVVDGDGG